jgi:hypothetical protein
MSGKKSLENPRALAMVISLLALLLVPAVALAFTYTVTQNSKMAVGSSRHVQMAGTYTLTAGELSLTRVQIVTLDRNGNLLSTAVGSSTGTTWSAGVGDFALAFYYVEFKVSTTTGTRTYRTSTYSW